MGGSFRIAANFLLILLTAAGAAQGQNIITTVAGGGPKNVPATTANLDFIYSAKSDSAGNVYIPDLGRCVVFKVNSAGTLTVFAGTMDLCGYSGDNGPATSAELNGASEVAIDAAGDVYIADTQNLVVRRVDGVTGTITTYAGTGGVACSSSTSACGDGGAATSATLNLVPSAGSAYFNGLVLDSAGDLFIADTFDYRVRVVNHSTLNISTYAGTGTAGYSGDGQAATQADLLDPNGLAMDTSGNLYIADLGNTRVRMVNTGSPPVINTVAGGGSGCANETDGLGDGCPATSAALSAFSGVGVDSAGNIYIADRYDNLIRVVNASTQIISVLGGNGTACASGLSACGDGGPATSGEVAFPVGLSVDSAGDVFIGDTNDYRIREIYCANPNITCTPPTGDSAGEINTFAGIGLALYSGNGVPATDACLSIPSRVAGDAAGDLYIADSGNSVVRMVDHTTQNITTVAGTPGVAGYTGDNGPATSAQLNTPFDVALDAGGNIYVADVSANVVREVTAATGTITTVAGGAAANCAAATDAIGDGCPATQAMLAGPYGVAFDSSGNMFIADGGDSVIRRVDHATTTITTFAGIPQEFSYGGDGGPATAAYLNVPLQAVFDGAGNLYIADLGNQVIREVYCADPALPCTPPAGFVAGYINTVAGNTQTGYSGDGGAATAAMLDDPFGVTADIFGNYFIGDAVNERVRGVDATTQIINTVAGNGTGGFSGDGGPATSAELDFPTGMHVDAAANLYIADYGNNRVREVSNSGGALVPTPIGVPFGNEAEGTASAPVIVTFSSTGPAALTITNLTVVGQNSGDFALVAGGTCGSVPITVAAGSSCTVEYAFTPSLVQAETATLLVTDNAPYSPQPIGLSGTGTPAASGPSLSTSPSTLAFGTQALGVTSTPPMTLAFSNPGASALVITALATTSGNASDFAQVAGAGTCGNLPITINANSNCTLEFTFTPSTIAAESTMLQVTDNATGSPQYVSFTGMGMGPVVSVPSSVDFGTLAEGATSSTVGITLTNNGNGLLNFTSPPTVTGTNASDFAIISSSCVVGTAVAASGGTCTVMMSFKPSTTTAENASLNFADNAVPSTQSVILEGTGTGPLSGFTMTTLPAGAVGVPYGADIQVTGGTPPYEFAVAEGSALPAGFAMTTEPNGNVSAGHVYSTSNPATTGTLMFNVTVTDATDNMTTATVSLPIGTSPANTQASLLNGQYALLVQSFSESSGTESGGVGSLNFNGSGSFTGVVDINNASGISQDLTATGTYSVGPDNRGFMALTTTAGTVYFAMSVGSVYRGVAYEVRLTKFTDNDGNDQIGTGFLKLQDPTAFNQNVFAGTFAYGLSGQYPGLTRLGEVGIVSFDDALDVTSGSFTVNDSGTIYNVTGLTGSYTALDTNGRTVLTETFTFTPAGSTTGTAAASSVVVYIIDANSGVAMTLDARDGNPIAIGVGVRQQNPGTYTTSSLAGPDVLWFAGEPSGGTGAAVGLFTTSVVDGTPTFSITADSNDVGTIGIGESLSGPYSVAANGTGSITFANTPGGGPDTVYFALAGQDTGFVMDSDSADNVGEFRLQSGAPFSASPFTSNLYFGVEETLQNSHEALSGIASVSTPGELIPTIDESHTGGDLGFDEAGGALNFTVNPPDGHFTISPNAMIGGSTGYVVSPFETAFLGTGGQTTEPAPSVHPQLFLAKTETAPPGTASPATTTVNYATAVAQATSAQSAAITFTNTGLGPTAFTGTNTTGSPDFNVSLGSAAAGTNACFPTTGIQIVRPQESCTVIITFTAPSGDADDTALDESLILESDGTTNVTVTLTGTVLAPTIGAAPNPVAFGNETEGVKSAAMTLTFSNTGGAPMTITGGLTATGENATDFIQVAGAGTCGALPITVAAGANCTVEYTFTPSTTAGESATLEVANNSATTPYAVTLMGTGTSPLPVVTFAPTAAAGVNFGAIAPGMTTGVFTETITVAAGTENLQLSGISIATTTAGAGANDFAFAAAGTTCPTDGGTLNAGTNCMVAMTFTPTLAGTENGTLTIAGTNLTGSPVVIPLTGIGASTAAGFVFTVQSTALGGNGAVVTLTPGESAIFPLVITPNTGFIGPVTVACGTVTPATNTVLCTIPTPTVTITTSPSAAMTVYLTFQTNCTVSLVGPRAPSTGPPWTAPPVGVVLLLAVLLAIQWRGRSSGSGRGWARRMVPACAMVLLVLLVMTWAACVKDPPPAIPGAPTTPAGTYTLPVTATAPGGVVRTLTLTINVT